MEEMFPGQVKRLSYGVKIGNLIIPNLKPESIPDHIVANTIRSHLCNTPK